MRSTQEDWSVWGALVLAVIKTHSAALNDFPLSFLGSSVLPSIHMSLTADVVKSHFLSRSLSSLFIRTAANTAEFKVIFQV